MNLTVQRACEADNLPADVELNTWAQAAGAQHEMTIRIVDETESAALNQKYRDKAGPTNVLSFPAETDDLPEELQTELGDLVICAPVVAREAAEQGKSAAAHWAHMVVHGILHLRGHDHIEVDEAEAMEALEIQILGELGFSDPYR